VDNILLGRIKLLYFSTKGSLYPNNQNFALDFGGFNELLGLIAQKLYDAEK